MTFNEYYQFYLSKHQDKNCRRMHILGQLVTLAYIILAPIYLGWYWLLLAPFVIYPIAWSGHIFFEGNRPAFFSSNPVKAKLADLRMMWDIFTGKLPL